jgi:hypothetical protein
MLFSYRPVLGVIILFFTVFLRHYTGADRCDRFGIRETILGTLFIAVMVGTSLLPNKYSEYSLIWLVPIVVFSLLWCAVREVRCYRKAPRFFLSNYDDRDR